MRTFVALIGLFIAGCTPTPEVGGSYADFASGCKAAMWQSPTPVFTTDQVTIYACPDAYGRVTNGLPVVSNKTGDIIRVATYQEAVDLAEDQRCRSFGFEYGTELFGQCRLELARVRAEREALVAAQRQAAASDMIAYGAFLQSLNQPYTAGNFRLSCRSRKLGNTVSTTCF